MKFLVLGWMSGLSALCGALLDHLAGKGKRPFTLNFGALGLALALLPPSDKSCDW